MPSEQTKTLPPDTEQGKRKFTEKQIQKLIAIFSPMPLIKYPYFVSLGRRNRKREVQYEEVTADGTKVKWTIMSPRYLPGEMELKVWCWILHKVSETPKPLPVDFYIPYTLSEIASYWDMPHGGRPRALIYKAIENLQNTSIHHWIQQPDEKTEDLSYSLLAGRAGQGAVDNETTLNRNVVFLDPILIRLLNKGPIKPSALEQIKSLADTNLIAARLYELLGWKFYFTRLDGQQNIRFMYSDIVKRIGLKREKYESVAQDQLFKAHNHLKEKKIILSGLKWQKKNNDWEITYKPGESLILEVGEWVKRKKIKGFVAQIEYNNPEVDCAVEEILNYTGDSKESLFQGLVRKIFKKHQNGFEVVLKAISETKQETAGGRVKNKAAYLTTILKKYAD